MSGFVILRTVEIPGLLRKTKRLVIRPVAIARSNRAHHITGGSITNVIFPASVIPNTGAIKMNRSNDNSSVFPSKPSALKKLFMALNPARPFTKSQHYDKGPI